MKQNPLAATAAPLPVIHAANISISETFAAIERGYSLWRKRKVLDTYGCSNTTLYDLISKGLFVPPVSIGGRSVAWVDNEVKTIIAARIAGKTDDEIKSIVRALVSQRTMQTGTGREAA